MKIIKTIMALASGFALTIRHILKSLNSWKNKNQYPTQKDYFHAQNQGIVTFKYPYEQIPVPENGRYQLHNEIDDCIVCDKCAEVCPVNCIDIVAIKSHENIGKTSDGTTIRMYAEKFDIDMAKCCYCGLCTAVCPTQCLTMTPEYDFSVADVEHLTFGFAKLSHDEAEQKRQAYESKLEEKQKAKKSVPVENKPSKLIFKRKSEATETDKSLETSLENQEPVKPKIVFKRKDPSKE